jgi:serine/threonine protein kinase
MDLVPNIWQDLKGLGFEGSIRSFDEFHKWLKKINLIYDPPKLKQKDGKLIGPDFLYSEFTQAMSGKFGVIYLAYRESPAHQDYVFLKICPKFPRSLLMEGILQQTAHSVLKQYGFPKAVPRVMDIVQHPIYGVIMGVERVPKSQLFADYLKNELHWSIPSVQNDRLILGVIAQVATYMAVLELAVGFNHRDLKSTNVLMIAPTEPWTHQIILGNNKWRLAGSHQAILIDFGMSCIGHSDSTPIISAGEYISSKIDFCPKQGRDLFMMFINLWNVPALRSSVTPKTCQLFKKWLRDHTPRRWADWLSFTTDTNLLDVYLHVNSDEFRSEPCNPIRVLQDISRVYPDICAFEIKSP